MDDVKLTESVDQLTDYIMKNCLWQFHSRVWEMRLTGRDGISRALYVTAVGKRVVVVRAFVKKTQKTPHAEIELALRRAAEVL